MPDQTQAPTRHFQCRHIFTDGRRCGSKCLHHQDFCYYHHTTRGASARQVPALRDALSTFELPLPEDRSAVQASIGLILQRIAAGMLDSRRAGLLLYGLQIASLNLPRPNSKELATPAESVEEVVLDPDHGPLAPPAELTRTAHELTLFEILTDRWERDKQAQESSTLPTIQATATLAPEIIPCPIHRSITAMSGAKQRRHPKIPNPTPTPLISKRRKAHPEGWAVPDLCRRSPNLPHTYACSTIGPTRLNFRVRDGNGCDPRGKLTGKL
jgi:hypothetical protein